MRMRLISTLVAVLLAVVGAVLILNYVRAADQRAYAEAETVDVLVVGEAVPAGTPVEELSSSLQSKAVPRAVVPDDAVTDLGQFAGRVASVDLVAGETLLAARLVDPSSLGTPTSIPAPEGLQEVTVAFGPEQAVGGRVVAGDHVGVYVTAAGIDPADTSPELLTHHFLHRVLVTGVQGVTAPEQGAADEAPLPDGSVFITFAATAADAERIIHAAQTTSLWLTLETEDDRDDGTAFVSGRTLLR